MRIILAVIILINPPTYLYSQDEPGFDKLTIDKTFNTHILGYIDNAKDSTTISLLDFYGRLSYTAYVIDRKFKFRMNLSEPKTMQINIPGDNPRTFNGRHLIISPGTIKIYADDVEAFNNLVINSAPNETMEYEKYFKQNGYKSNLTYTENNPDSFLAIFFLWQKRNDLTKVEIEKYFGNLSSMWMHTTYYEDIKQTIENLYELIVGNKFIDFKLTDEDENLIELSMFKGKYLLIEFTASWCKPCIEQIPYQKAVYQKFKDRGLEILHIYIEDKPQMVESKTKHGIPWLTVYEPKKIMSEVAQKAKVASLPTFFLLDPDGIIIVDNNSNARLRNEQLEIELRKYIK
jgi:peroxiredoxin